MGIAWERLTSVVIEAAVGKITGDVLALLASAILETKQEELRLLESIQRDTSALLQGPFNTAMLHLEDAKRSNRSESEKREEFGKAKDALYIAFGNEKDMIDRRAAIEYYIGVCWLSLGRHDDSAEWLNRSFLSVHDVLAKLHYESGGPQRELDREAQDLNALGLMGVLALAVVVPWAWVSDKWTKGRIKDKLRSSSILSIANSLKDLGVEGDIVGLELKDDDNRLGSLLLWARDLLK